MNVATRVAHLIVARQNCESNGNTEWVARHTEALEALLEELPSGSGIDHGIAIDLAASEADRLVFSLEFHHMDECGMYDGWTSHTVTVTPAFDGINLRISGRNRNMIKEYLHELLHDAFMQEIAAV